jgi:hypothetical protein
MLLVIARMRDLREEKSGVKGGLRGVGVCGVYVEDLGLGLRRRDGWESRRFGGKSSTKEKILVDYALWLC